MAKKNNGANLGFEQKMWQAADKMRSNMDAAEAIDELIQVAKRIKEDQEKERSLI